MEYNRAKRTSEVVGTELISEKKKAGDL